MHTLKMVSVPFSMGLQAVPMCLCWCSIKIELPSLSHKKRWLIIKVKMLLSCLHCRTLIRHVNSYQVPSYLSSCAFSAGVPHQTPRTSMGALLLVMWKHNSCWSLQSVALQAHCGQGLRDVVHRKEMLKEKNQWLLRLIQCMTAYYYIYVYILFIYSKVVHLVSQPDGEVKVKLKCFSFKYSQGHILVRQSMFFLPE